MKRVEKQTVYECDCCHRASTTGVLTECPVCGKECCYTCSSQLYDVWHTNICKCCLEKPEIKAYYMNAWKNVWGKKQAKIIKEMQEKFS